MIGASTTTAHAINPAEKGVELLQSGYWPIRLDPAHKGTTRKNWQQTRYANEHELRAAFPYGHNVGIITGTPCPNDPSWLVVAIDMDWGEGDNVSKERALRCTPPDTYPTRTGANQNVHMFCLSDFPFNGKSSVGYKAHDDHPFRDKALDENGKRARAEVEIRGPGRLSMLPPSIHPQSWNVNWIGPSLESYHIVSLPRLSSFRLQEFAAITAEPHAAIHQIADCGPGSIHNSIIAAIGWMVNNSWPDQDVEDRMFVLWQQLSDEYDEKDLDRDERKFTAEWQTALRTAQVKYEADAKPSRSAKTGGSLPGEAKAKLQRIMAQWWISTHTKGNIVPAKDALRGVRIYSHGWWRPVESDTILKELLDQFDIVTMKDAKEALNTITGVLPPLPSANADLFCCRNGTINIRTLAFGEHSPDDSLLQAVDFDYDPDAPCPVYNKFLEETFSQVHFEDVDTRSPDQLTQDSQTMADTWEEFAGYCLTSGVELQAMLILVGPTASGKSLIANTLSWVLPEGSIGGSKLKEMEDSRFHWDILNKAVNICYETGNTYTEASEFINSTVAGDLQGVRRMREDPVNVRAATKLIFVGNRMMKTNDSSGAIQRRMVTILAPNSRLEAADRDTTLPERMRKETSAIFSRYVVAGNQVLNRKKFLSNHFSARANEDNRNRSDSVRTWFDARIEYDGAGNIPNEWLYADYTNWAKNNGFKPFNSIEWGTRFSQIDSKLGARQTHVPGTKNRKIRSRRVKMQEGLTLDAGPGGGSAPGGRGNF